MKEIGLQVLNGKSKTVMVLVAAGIMANATPTCFAQRPHQGAHQASPPRTHEPEKSNNGTNGRPSRVPDRPYENPGRFSQNRESRREVPRPPAPPSQGHAGSWLLQHRDLPPAQQEKALENSPDFRKLPPEKQERLKQRLERFDRLSPQQQERIIQRMHTFQHLTAQQQQTVRDFQHQMQNLPPGRRQMVRTALRDLRQMPPEQRQQVLSSPRFQNIFTPQERRMLNDAVQLPLAPATPESPREDDEPQ